MFQIFIYIYIFAKFVVLVVFLSTPGALIQVTFVYFQPCFNCSYSPFPGEYVLTHSQKFDRFHPDVIQFGSVSYIVLVGRVLLWCCFLRSTHIDNT